MLLVSLFVAAAGALAADPEAAPASSLVTLPGFKAERLYSVPSDSQGSWVSLTFDPKGRIITSDQYGNLYRITPPALGTEGQTQVEELKVDFGHAQGLLFVGDTLYAVVNEGGDYKNGLYRMRDTNADDQLDEVKLLRAIPGNGEHGPHAVVLGPDGKSLYVIAGNFTAIPQPETSKVPKNWNEDQLLERIPDGGGHDPHIKAPAGWVAKTDLEGNTWELVAMGMRNAYDMAFNRDGELFTYDSDMEWDIGAPWYRPTRVCHIVSGADYGWRNGSGKFPPYYPDSWPAAAEIGPGSPTGVTFGYGAKFPEKYQRALLINDWSYGIIYAVHLEADGSTYQSTFENFVTGQPLPVTDSAIGPDGAFYFATGGRHVQSGLYRVSYVGVESTTPLAETDQQNAACATRRKLEEFHTSPNPRAVETAWPYLSNDDRFIRQAARIAIEHQPVAEWQDRALAERQPWAAITAIVALARCGDKSLQSRVLEAFSQINWDAIDEAQRLALIRAYDLTFIRMGRPEDSAATVASRFEPLYPSQSLAINLELAMLLCYLEAPTAVRKTIALLQQAVTQEDQVHYLLALRGVKAGWSPEDRRVYFTAFRSAAGFKGGHSFALMVKHIKKDAIKGLSPEEKKSLGELLADVRVNAGPPAPPRPLVKEYTFDEVLKLCEGGLKDRNLNRGRQMFAIAQCANCHRFAGEGGIGGPDLTQIAGRFQLRDLLDSIFDPSKTVSDQYQATMFVTDDGKQIVGRVVNMSRDNIMVLPNLLAPDEQITLNRKHIEQITPAKLSMMPTGLLNTLQEDELLDLMAYLMSRGVGSK